MRFNGKDTESEVFYGATPEEANSNLLQGSSGRNLLNADLSKINDKKYCILAIFEKKQKQQTLTEG